MKPPKITVVLLPMTEAEREARIMAALQILLGVRK